MQTKTTQLCRGSFASAPGENNLSKISAHQTSTYRYNTNCSTVPTEPVWPEPGQAGRSWPIWFPAREVIIIIAAVFFLLLVFLLCCWANTLCCRTHWYALLYSLIFFAYLLNRVFPHGSCPLWPPPGSVLSLTDV